MELHFRETSKKRNEMVAAIAQELNIKATYKGMPSAAYEIGSYTVNRDGSLSFADDVSLEESSRVIDACVMAGFDPIEWDKNTEPEETEADDDLSLTVSMPRELFTDSQLDNLQKLIDAKGSLLKTALAVDALPVIVTEEAVSFPWFTRDIDAEHCAAYTCLITSICKMAKEAKRVTAKEKDTDNPKYAFRCFLLRLGFIGDAFKMNRKILLENLSGSSAFKSKAAKCDESEVTE